MWNVTMLMFIFFILLFLILREKRQIDSRHKHIKVLVRQCARWLLASTQDNSPMIALLHCQYGMGYLWAISDICTDSEFYTITGKHWKPFVEHATQIQDKVTLRVIETCPQFKGDIDAYFLEFGK